MMPDSNKKEYARRIKEILLVHRSYYFDISLAFTKEETIEIIDLVFLGKKVYDVSICEVIQQIAKLKVMRYSFTEESLVKLRQLYEQYGDLL